MAKRKSSKQTPAQSKKAKVSSPSLLAPREIETLGQETMQKAKYNNIATLLAQFNQAKAVLVEKEDEAVESAARAMLLQLFNIFLKIWKENTMSEQKDEKKQVIAKWLQDKYSKFKQLLCWLVENRLSFELSVQLDALDLMLGLVRVESDDAEFAAETYEQLARLLLFSQNGTVLANEATDNFVLLEFVEKFAKYWDLQSYFFLYSIADELAALQEEKSVDTRNLFANYLTIIKDGLLYTSDQETLREKPLWISGTLPATAYKVSFKTRYQKFFLAMMKVADLSTSQYKALLLILHKRIIPYLGSPACLMDFLTDAYDQEEDEIVPILALNSLWELVKSYNLEYPDFYTKLYSLLTPSILYTRYRSRFFRLCDLFLSSTHLSANLVASFIKKLARLALTASAPGVVIVIPFIYNLLKRHPTCMIMVQNSDVTDYVDPFDANEKDPYNTGAMGSSLWELQTLMSHYHPNVATLAKIFGEPFRKPSYNLEDFLDWSYLTLLESEIKRRYKGLASLEYEEWDSLFDDKSEKVYMSGWVL